MKNQNDQLGFSQGCSNLWCCQVG